MECFFGLQFLRELRSCSIYVCWERYLSDRQGSSFGLSLDYQTKALSCSVFDGDRDPSRLSTKLARVDRIVVERETHILNRTTSGVLGGLSYGVDASRRRSRNLNESRDGPHFMTGDALLSRKFLFAKIHCCKTRCSNRVHLMYQGPHLRYCTAFVQVRFLF
jgi:hypothetical protein